MMELKINCEDCLHNKMCRFKGNAESDFEKLANTMYGNGVNDDYSWEIMLSSRHVNVTFSCADFLKKIFYYIKGGEKYYLILQYRGKHLREICTPYYEKILRRIWYENITEKSAGLIQI